MRNHYGCYRFVIFENESHFVPILVANLYPNRKGSSKRARHRRMVDSVASSQQTFVSFALQCCCRPLHLRFVFYGLSAPAWSSSLKVHASCSHPCDYPSSEAASEPADTLSLRTIRSRGFASGGRPDTGGTRSHVCRKGAVPRVSARSDAQPSGHSSQSWLGGGSAPPPPPGLCPSAPRTRSSSAARRLPHHSRGKRFESPPPCTSLEGRL
mmetsp:Transcript_29744/g.72454  ORF Transcript_29744/g.72454 Transcript_29744/m.72454 type:complete len:211 (-) Transcript_29744:261-893(-)